MGVLLNKILNSFSQMQAKILILGLDGAGKTTILYQMKLNETVAAVPTISFNVEEISYKQMKFTVWDIGGQSRLRDLWHHYYRGNDAIIYVLDSSDNDRLQLAKETLNEVVNHDEMSKCPILIFANKMDLSTLKPVQIVQRLGLHQSRKRWHLQPCCGITGDGLVEGFQWLRKQTKSAKK